MLIFSNLHLPSFWNREQQPRHFFGLSPSDCDVQFVPGLDHRQDLAETRWVNNGPPSIGWGLAHRPPCTWKEALAPCHCNLRLFGTVFGYLGWVSQVWGQQMLDYIILKKEWNFHNFRLSWVTGNCSSKAWCILQALKRSICVLATRANVMKDPMVIGKDQRAAVVSYSSATFALLILLQQKENSQLTFKDTMLQLHFAPCMDGTIDRLRTLGD